MPFLQSRVARLVAGIAVLGVLGIIVAAGAWWFFIREDADLATSPLPISTEGPDASATSGSVDPTATLSGGDEPTNEPDGEPQVSSIEDGEVLTIVASHPSVQGETEAAYFADEELASFGVPSTAKGATGDVTGQIFLNGAGIHPDHESKIVVVVASLQSNESRRDSRMRGALDVTNFPEAIFIATGLSGFPAEFPENEEVLMGLTGLLTIHGVEQEVTWDVVAVRSGDVMTALATLETRYEDWDVPVLNIGGFVSVEEDVALQLQIIAQVS